MLAADIAQRFLRTMYATWSSNTPFRHKMVEKWDASIVSGTGGGGEYRVQTGASACRYLRLPSWCQHLVTISCDALSTQVSAGATA